LKGQQRKISGDASKNDGEVDDLKQKVQTLKNEKYELQDKVREAERQCNQKQYEIERLQESQDHRAEGDDDDNNTQININSVAEMENLRQ